MYTRRLSVRQCVYPCEYVLDHEHVPHSVHDRKTCFRDPKRLLDAVDTTSRFVGLHAY